MMIALQHLKCASHASVFEGFSASCVEQGSQFLPELNLPFNAISYLHDSYPHKDEETEEYENPINKKSDAKHHLRI